MTVNQRVAGSSPAGGAFIKRILQKCRILFLFLTETILKHFGLVWISFKTWGLGKKFG